MMSIDAVRGLHLDRAEDIVPVAADLGQHGVEICLAVARNQVRCVVRARGLAEEEDDLDTARSAAARSLVRSAPQGSRPAPTVFDSGAAPASAAGLSSVPLRPMNSRRSPVQSVWRPARSANATRDPKAAFQGLRANIAPVSGSISVVTNGAEALRDGPSTHST